MADNCLRGIQKFRGSLCFLLMCVLSTVVFGYGDGFTASTQSILMFAGGGLLLLIFLIFVARSMYRYCCQPRSLNMNILDEFGDEMPLEVLSRIVSINDHTQTYEYRNNGGEGNICASASCLVEFRDSDMVLKIESCSHVFHEDCVYNWLREHMTCPTCQLPVDSP